MHTISVMYSTQASVQTQPNHGKFCADGIWRKSVRESRHLLRLLPGWAVDIEDLHAAEAAGVHMLELHDRETGAVYRVELSVFRECGLEIDFGFGPQMALALEHWDVHAGVRQLRFWEAA